MAKRAMRVKKRATLEAVLLDREARRAAQERIHAATTIRVNGEEWRLTDEARTQLPGLTDAEQVLFMVDEIFDLLANVGMESRRVW